MFNVQSNHSELKIKAPKPEILLNW